MNLAKSSLLRKIKTNEMNMKTPSFIHALRGSLLLFLLAAGFSVASHAQTTSQYMSYQGYLTDGNGNALGSTNTGPKAYDVVFRMWDAATGGNELFSELQTVTVDNGYFSVLLGQGTAYSSEPTLHVPLANVFTNSAALSRYVEMTVLGIGTGGYITILPRLQLVSSPFAFQAASALNVTGTNIITAANIASNTITAANIAPNAITAANLSTNLGVWQTAGSNIFYSSGNVGIGTNNPIWQLQVNGAVSSGSGFYFYDRVGPSYPYWSWYASGGDALLWNSIYNNNVVSVTSNGWVGIGTTTPNAPLEVVGTNQFPHFTVAAAPSASFGAFMSVDATATAGGKNYYIFSSGGTASEGQGKLIFKDQTTGVESLVIASNGNIGIGNVLSPGANTVQINPQYESANGYALEVNNPVYGENIQIDTTSTSGLGLVVDDVANGGTAPLILCRNNMGSSGVTVLNVQANGNVGIGTGSPAVPLDVQGQLSYYLNNNAYYYGLSGTSLNGGGSAESFNISIRAAGYVQGYAFVAVSDGRIKQPLHQSNPTEDLATLNKIKVTDYTYIDKVAMGNGVHKKVIAQELEQAYPQAVSKTTNFIPDIYALAANVGQSDGTLLVTMSKPHGLREGDKVKWMADTGGEIQSVVSKVDSDVAFEIKHDGKVNKAFVYGRQVDDFRVVDYEAVSMLNVSATQELAKRMEKLESREAHMAELEQKAAKLDTLEQEVADLRKTVAQLAGAVKAAKIAEAPVRAETAAQPSFTTASLEH